VKATAEVQAAARKVAGENEHLRALLELLGVSGEGVEGWLRTGDISYVKAGQSQVGSSSREADNPQNLPTPSSMNGGEVCLPTASRPDCGSRNALSAALQMQHAISDTAPVAPSATFIPSKRIAETDLSEIRTASNNTSSAAQIPLDTPSKTFQPEVRAPNPAPRDEISCLDAAEIIAGMRGHDRPEDVLPELGCGNRRSCTAKTMAIYQIMDQ
jgi:hypothetical protein